MKITVQQLADELGVRPEQLRDYAPLQSVDPAAFIPEWIARGIRRQVPRCDLCGGYNALNLHLLGCGQTAGEPVTLANYKPSEYVKIAVDAAGIGAIEYGDGEMSRESLNICMRLAMQDLTDQGAADFLGDVSEQSMDELLTLLVRRTQSAATRHAIGQLFRDAFGYRAN